MRPRASARSETLAAMSIGGAMLEQQLNPLARAGERSVFLACRPIAYGRVRWKESRNPLPRPCPLPLQLSAPGAVQAEPQSPAPSLPLQLSAPGAVQDVLRLHAFRLRLVHVALSTASCAGMWVLVGRSMVWGCTAHCQRSARTHKRANA